MIVRHQRESASNQGFRQLARYIQGRNAKPRATWFHACNLPGVSRTDDLELACRLVEAVQAQNTRAGSKRTYHLVISLHPEDRSLNAKEFEHIVKHLVDVLGFSEHQYIAVRHSDKDHEHVHVAINKIHPGTFLIHSPAWDHQKLFAEARALELELGLTPLRSRARDRENVPQRAADCEAHQGIGSFARWAREHIRPVLAATELRSWHDVHGVCRRFGVVIQPHGNGLVFEDVDRKIRVKASFVARELSKTRLCKELGPFQPASSHHLEATRRGRDRYSPMPSRVPESLWKEYEQSLDQARIERQEAWKNYRRTALRERRQLKQKHGRQRAVVATLPVSGRDRKQLLQQLALQLTIEARTLKRKLAVQRRAIQKTPHPGTWRHFVASRAAHRDTRALRLLRRREWERGRSKEEREL